MDDLQAAYFAGLLDGEGTITVEKSGNTHNPGVSITNTDRSLIDAIMLAFPGGNMRHRKRPDGQKDAIEIRWRYRRALAMIAAVEPFLIAKAQVARLVLSWDSVVQRNGKYSPEAGQKKQDLIAAVRQLNQRGEPIPPRGV